MMETENTQLKTASGFMSWIRKTTLSELEFILFGFAMMLGNRTSNWNQSLVYGYDAVVFNLLFAGAGFVCLCLCMGEMSSAMPFSGGIFGFVRAVLGPFNGFLVASCEFVYATAFIVVKVQSLINLITTSGYTDTCNGNALVIAIYGFCLSLCLIGERPVFALTNLIGFFIFMLLLVYLLGTLSQVGTDSVNFNHYSGPYIPISWAGVMGGRIACGTQYNGMQYFPLLSGFLKEPREQVPRMLMITCFSFILFSMFISLAAISQEPGGAALGIVDLPLKFGFARIFNMNIPAAKWLDFPCLLGSVFGLFFCSGKQVFAIAKSGLLPTFLDKTIPGVESPYLCYTLAAVLGAGLNIFSLHYPDYLVQIRATSLIASFYIFILCFIAFMVFKRKFSSMTRTFVNPLGDIAAIFGIVNFISASIALIFYFNILPYFLIGFGGYLILATIFFWTYLVKNQKFSEEEKKLMFKAYLINANQQARKKQLKNNKVGPSSNSSVGSSSNAGSSSNRSRGSKTQAGGGVFSTSILSSMPAAPSMMMPVTQDPADDPRSNPTTMQEDENNHVSRVTSSHDKTESSVRQAELVPLTSSSAQIIRTLDHQEREGFDLERGTVN